MTPPGPTDRREFVIATANPDKAQEIAEILGPAVTLLPRPAEVGEIEETGETLLDNARLKAHALAQATGRPAIADDTGLEVDELDGAPGVRSARYAGEHATYTENVAKLLAALDGLPGLRRARFRTVALAAWPDGREVVGEGAVEGVISREPRGRSGFGYDPVFIPTEGDGRTFAEMDSDEKNRISHRGRAFRDLTRQLPGPARPASPAAGRRDRWVDAAMALAIGLCVVVVHDVPYLLRHPFWLDEAWVADSTRAGIGSASFLTSSTPLGWTVLLRVVPGSGQQDLRLLPLAFAGLAAGAGYLFGREVFHGEHRLLQISAGVLTGAAVLLSPIMLLQDDLKQYTAEAFTTIALLVLVARLESRWSRRRLAAVALFAGLALLISNAVVFVGAAAMGGLAVECLVRRQWSRLRDVVVAAVVMVAIMLGLYELIVAPHVNSSLSSFWAPYYLPRHRGLSGALSWIHLRFLSLAHYFGFRRLSIDAAVCLLGLVALVWMRRVALAVMMPLTVVVLIVASAAKKYPFGDARTSTFWTVMAPVAMALAAAGVARLMTTRLNVWAAVVPVAAALAIWVPLVHPDIRDHSLPNEDARSQLNYLDSHRQPNDVVILDWGASYAVAYYDRQLTPTFLHEDAVGVGFQPVYPHVPWLVEMLDRNASDVADALATAQADIEAEPANSRGRIWIIRSHVGTAEADAWAHDLAGKNVTTLPVGPEPLLLYQP